MEIPLQNRLKKKKHIQIARLQDEVIEVIYNIENKAILHGGASIWRCYKGRRFSEDLDFYLTPSPNFKKIFEKELHKRGLIIKKYKSTRNVIFSKVTDWREEIRIEVMFSKTKKPIVMPYEKIDGTFIDVFTLSPEELLLEKLDAYKNRRVIRDIYDVYFLSNFIKDISKNVLFLQ